ncbi:C2H2-type zinc finger protein [Endozoicomonas sp. 4G]|uniref:C2H2-type zinc finger protein n=1 Tax=Endozoicomonas sp. 4G TaxID=2872754 RepID=UPI002078F356|nr:C2H2-type zinc finger protein [Endozoicomonas sp. 4G]
MLLKKPLILTLAVAFSVHCSKGHAQENRLSLLFTLTVGKVLIEWHHFDMPRVCFDDDLLLKPDTRYGFSPDSGVEARTYRRAASDDSAYSEDSDSDSDSDSEDKGTSDENSNNSPEEDKTDTETDVQCVNTTPDPFQALNEFSEYCATLRLRMINQEPTSDSEIATGSGAIHLPADLRPKKPKVHQCDLEDCNYRSDRADHLKKHKQTHLPADQRPKKPKVHHCDHKGCSYSTNRADDLKKHKQTHLPDDQRLKVHQCDHQGCNYRTDYGSTLKMHKQTHLPADQRPKAHQCDHEGCNYTTIQAGNLKRHIQTHLPADQRLKRPKRKVYDQPPSNKKRKKNDKE